MLHDALTQQKHRKVSSDCVARCELLALRVPSPTIGRLSLLVSVVGRASVKVVQREHACCDASASFEQKLGCVSLLSLLPAPCQSTPELLTAPLHLAARVTVFYGVVVLTGATAVGGLRQAPDGRGRPAAEAQSVGGRHQGDRLTSQEHQRAGRSLQSERRRRRRWLE